LDTRRELYLAHYVMTASQYGLDNSITIVNRFRQLNALHPGRCLCGTKFKKGEYIIHWFTGCSKLLTCFADGVALAYVIFRLGRRIQYNGPCARPLGYHSPPTPSATRLAGGFGKVVATPTPHIGIVESIAGLIADEKDMGEAMVFVY
jgi:hypothetical protein